MYQNLSETYSFLYDKITLNIVNYLGYSQKLKYQNSVELKTAKIH